MSFTRDDISNIATSIRDLRDNLLSIRAMFSARGYVISQSLIDEHDKTIAHLDSLYSKCLLELSQMKS